MKKVLVLIITLLLICGCSNDENSLVKKDYINNNDYNTVYSDLLSAVNDVSYIPSKETEKNFYELIEVISDNCNKFSNDELNNLYSIMNNDYQFTYSKDRYNNEAYQNDLNLIKTCITE